MITPRELISMCRQIGGMMEAGVDILRITRVLRAQTENARLLDLFNDIDHGLTMGRGLADVLARQSDVFSPFAISLIRQGEERNDIGSAFLRLADFLQKETDLQKGAPTARPDGAAEADQNTLVRAAPADFVGGAPASPGLEVLWLRSLWLLAGGSLAVAIVLAGSEIGWVEERWRAPIALFLCALLLGSAAWHWQRGERNLTGAEDKTSADFPEAREGKFYVVLAAPAVEDTQPDAPSDWDQSTLNGAPNHDAVPDEKTSSEAGEADATTVLDRFKQRPARPVGSEEEFD